MKFKVGDKVRIREDLVRNEEYGAEAFVFLMEDFKGKIATIKKVYRGFYKLEEFDHNWTDEMLETIDGSERLTFDEVMSYRQPNQTWIGENYIIHTDRNNDITIESKYGEDLGSSIYLQAETEYILENKKYSFQKAFEFYENGRIIVSSYGYMYKKEGNRDLVNEEGTWMDNEESFAIEEIRGEWSIR